jgi:hypothetical protein
MGEADRDARTLRESDFWPHGFRHAANSKLAEPEEF